ncbi:hypothetical protein FIBSPDRAFT_98289 [Athelia psychrophila]|uniref:Uncharacterized protein n=1 Tax=Athelia psychrophila TaxID=1759441 RepID=A0A166DQH8_9AGAM|nr:hypothetical protein FIBSPDRAFT_98289 [Fibularhizoctonia sp. CBS 109695]
MYPFRGVLFDADESEDLDETLSSPASSLFGAMTPLTELSEDDDDDESEGKGAPAADETGEPIGLGLTLHNEEQVLESSINAQPCVERDTGPASTSAVGLGITLAEDAHAVDKQVCIPSQLSAIPQF